MSDFIADEHGNVEDVRQKNPMTNDQRFSQTPSQLSGAHPHDRIPKAGLTKRWKSIVPIVVVLLIPFLGLGGAAYLTLFGQVLAESGNLPAGLYCVGLVNALALLSGFMFFGRLSHRRRRTAAIAPGLGIGQCKNCGERVPHMGGFVGYPTICSSCDFTLPLLLFVGSMFLSLVTDCVLICNLLGLM